MNSDTVRLTQTVKKSGCAAKLPPDQLSSVLDSLQFSPRKELLLGAESFDDGAVWDLGNGQVMIKSLDFFTPIVDDPFDFGAVAAANALSDIYAMGGSPALALTILAFPSNTLDNKVLQTMMAGALEKIQESGACLAGGHSIDDDTLKLGFSVTGFVDKNRTWTNSGAKPGDALILSKPLGTGTLVSANKNGEAEPEWMVDAIESMKQLNRIPEMLIDFDVHAATDITGFSLAGHSMQLAKASGVTLEIEMSELPALRGATYCLRNGILNKAHKTNEKYITGKVSYAEVDPELRWLTLDPQTSGGLLLSVPSSESKAILSKISSRFPNSKIIGEVTRPSSEKVKFV